MVGLDWQRRIAELSITEKVYQGEGKDLNGGILLGYPTGISKKNERFKL
jgi:hypothetical protein